MGYIGYLLTAISIALGLLYFVSNRRHAEVLEARAEMKRINVEQESLKERVAVMEKTAQFLDVQIKSACESADKQMDAYKDLLLDIKGQFATTVKDLRVSVDQLQAMISDLRVSIAEHSK